MGYFTLASVFGHSVWSSESDGKQAVVCVLDTQANEGTMSLGIFGGGSGKSLALLDSRFFSSVLKNTLIVVRKLLFGGQSSTDSGECSQTGHDKGRLEWPMESVAYSVRDNYKTLIGKYDAYRFRIYPARNTVAGRH